MASSDATRRTLEDYRDKCQAMMNTEVVKARDTERDKIRDQLRKAKEDSESWKKLYEAKKKGLCVHRSQATTSGAKHG